MIIGSYTLPDPQSFDVTDYVGTTEEILLQGIDDILNMEIIRKTYL
jgi:hypothetical protein